MQIHSTQNFPHPELNKVMGICGKSIQRTRMEVDG
jgi:hypothetical protein